MLNLNIRSFNANINNFRELLASLKGVSVLLLSWNRGVMKQQMRNLYEAQKTIILLTKQKSIKKEEAFAFVYRNN